MKKGFYSKIFAVTLVFVVLFSGLSVYADTPSSWAQAEVDEARSKGLVLPEADDNFQDPITRDLFCKLVVNLVEQTTEEPISINIANPFEDTNSTDILKAYQLGIVNGMSTTEFGPDLLITREQVAAMIMRAARELDDLMEHHFTSVQFMGDPNFADLDDISSWALVDIRTANAIGVMKGVGNNEINPKGNTTIEQSILLILRVYNEYLPMKDNNAPAALPTGTFEFDVVEGGSKTVLLSEIAYDEDGDPLRISGISGNNTYGDMISDSTSVTFNANMVEEDSTSIWTVSVTDEVEKAHIELVFNIIDNPNEPPMGLQIAPFSVDEGETVTFSTEDVASDPEEEVLLFTDFKLNEDMTSPKGNGQIYLSLVDNPNTFSFTADMVLEDTYTVYDMTISDGTNEIVIPVRIDVNNVNDPPVANPLTTIHQDEGTVEYYWGNSIATDPDDDGLQVIDFEISEENQHNVGTGSIGELYSNTFFQFSADEVTTSTWTYFDLTVTDGIHETVVTIRIQVDDLD